MFLKLYDLNGYLLVNYAASNLDDDMKKVIENLNESYPNWFRFEKYDNNLVVGEYYRFDLSFEAEELKPEAIEAKNLKNLDTVWKYVEVLIQSKIVEAVNNNVHFVSIKELEFKDIFRMSDFNVNDKFMETFSKVLASLLKTKGFKVEVNPSGINVFEFYWS